MLGEGIQYSHCRQLTHFAMLLFFYVLFVFLFYINVRCQNIIYLFNKRVRDLWCQCQFLVFYCFSSINKVSFKIFTYSIKYGFKSINLGTTIFLKFSARSLICFLSCIHYSLECKIQLKFHLLVRNNVLQLHFDGRGCKNNP